MHKKYRLRANADFERLRREGRSVAHPLLVLLMLPNNREISRFGFAVGRKIGKAARRNRVKRRMREAVRQRLARQEVAAGWDILLIARRPIAETSYQQVDEAIGLLLRRAKLIDEGLP
jgi:ribonuclease P protein component